MEVPSLNCAKRPDLCRRKQSREAISPWIVVVCYECAAKGSLISGVDDLSAVPRVSSITKDV